MMDYLDLIRGAYNQFFSGTYYAIMPQTPNDSGIPFHYDMMDPASWSYRKAFGNVMSNDARDTAIKSRDAFSWKVGAYVCLQDGKLYTILAVQQDYASINKEVYRTLSIPAGIEYAVRLSEVDNPWGIR